MDEREEMLESLREMTTERLTALMEACREVMKERIMAMTKAVMNKKNR